MMRFTRSAERDERLSAEIEAVHRVQEQLIPAQLPATPGFTLEAAYRAAGEVGGDFYQVFPQSDDSLLVAIGDVSGKGQKAAMLGSLVVGALRALAQENPRPSQVHSRLNTQLVTSSDGVVEARNAAGELFGFERAAQTSIEPASKVARVAQAFDQEDDITVLTLIRHSLDESPELAPTQA